MLRRAPRLAILLWLTSASAALAQSSQAANVQEGPAAQQKSELQQGGGNPAPPLVAQPENAEQRTAPASDHRPDERKDTWLSGWNLSDKIAATAIFIGFLQFVALVATVRVMLLTARRQLRAYLAVQPTKATNVYPERSPRVDFVISNTGQTPAYNVRYVAMAEVLEYPLPPHQGDLVSPKPGQRLPSRVVHSQITMDGEAISEAPITFEQWQQITEGDAQRFYLAGKVLYDDVFGQTHETKFCAFVGGPELGKAATVAFANRAPIVVVPTEWVFSDVHNEAT